MLDPAFAPGKSQCYIGTKDQLDLIRDTQRPGHQKSEVGPLESC